MPSRRAAAVSKSPVYAPVERYFHPPSGSRTTIVPESIPDATRRATCKAAPEEMPEKIASCDSRSRVDCRALRVDTLILRPLAYPEADRLVAIHEIVPKFSHLAPMIPVNAMHFREWRQKARSFDQLALLGGVTFSLTGNGEPERIPAARVSSNLFPLLGIQAQLGRTFLDEEDRPGHDRVVVLNHELWIRRFGADPKVIGRKIVLDGNPYEIVGVLRAGLHFPKLNQLYALTIAEDRPQLWKPFAIRDDELDEMGDFNFACIGRLRRGVVFTA